MLIRGVSTLSKAQDVPYQKAMWYELSTGPPSVILNVKESVKGRKQPVRN